MTGETTHSLEVQVHDPKYWFDIDRLPGVKIGGGSDELRQQWIGLRLPIKDEAHLGYTDYIVRALDPEGNIIKRTLERVYVDKSEAIRIASEAGRAELVEWLTRGTLPIEGRSIVFYNNDGNIIDAETTEKPDYLPGEGLYRKDEAGNLTQIAPKPEVID